MGLVKIVFLVTLVVITVLSAVLLQYIFSYKPGKPDLVEDAWWGSGPRKENRDTKVNRIKIQVSDAILTDLKNRLKNTRYQTDLEEGDFNYGFQATYMKEIVKYWLEKYDWRKHEAILNKFEHYKTNIEGLDIHFIHAKPQKTTKTVVPLLMMHGWPGSVWEFYKALPLLTDVNQDIVFEVICPSIPGFGYSDAPKKKGFDQVDTARIYVKLMKRLGFDNYFIQGGDWGSAIASIMAAAYPQHILGLHSNFFNVPFLPKTFFKMTVGAYLPSLIYEPGEAEMVYPLGPKLKEMLIETGYNHIQATKPDTVGMGLTDSPVGLAAYMLEKFGYCANKEYRNRADGGTTEKYTLDELLTNVMIYWTNQNVVSSLRFYKELYAKDAHPWLKVEVTVPTGLAQFPHEVLITPRTLAADKFTNIIQYTVMPAGGHFAALEEPKLLADDVRNFVKKVTQLNKIKKVKD